MKTQTALFLELWQEARTRLSNQLPGITEQDLRKKMPGSPNSAGFLLRHIGDVEWLFAKNVFGAADLKVIAKTVIAKTDTGEWTNFKEIQEYLAGSSENLKRIIESQTEADWETVIETREFGRKTKAEALGRIVSHTAYHAGQLAIVLKYGQIV